MKKQILATLKKMQAHLRTIEAHNQLIDDNVHNSRHRGSQLSFNVKMHNWLDIDDVQKIAEQQMILFNDALIQEFNDDRLYGIRQHCCDDLFEQFLDSVNYKDFESPFYNFTNSKNIALVGRSGGHILLGNAEDFKIDLRDLEDYDNSPLTIWDSKTWATNFCLDLANFNLDTFIEEMKEYCPCTNQKDLLYALKKTCSDWQYWADKATKETDVINKLEAYIEETKKGFKKILLDRLEEEVREFGTGLITIDNAVSMIEQGEYSTINRIVRVENNALVTDYNARVMIDHVKRILAVLEKHGAKAIVGKRIGAYMIKHIEPCNNGDMLLEIGCHFLSLNQCKQFINQ